MGCFGGFAFRCCLPWLIQHGVLVCAGVCNKLVPFGVCTDIPNLAESTVKQCTDPFDIACKFDAQDDNVTSPFIYRLLF